MNQSDRDLLLGEIHADVKTLVATSAKHDGRILKLESTQSTQKGAITVVVTVISALWALLLAAFEHWHTSNK